MRSLIITIIFCIAVNTFAQTENQEMRRFLSLEEFEKIAFWWEHDDVASLAEYARVLSEQSMKQKALAIAIRFDLMVASSSLSAVNLGKVENSFAQILSAMSAGPERDVLTSWLRDTGLNANASRKVTEKDARQLEEKQHADIKRNKVYPSVVLSRAFTEIVQTNTSNVIAQAWRDSDPTNLLNIANQRLATDTNDLAGLCMKLDFLVFQSFAPNDATEIERLLSHLKVHYQNQEHHAQDEKIRVVQKWLNFSLPAYEEALAVLKSENEQEIVRMRQSFRSAKQNGVLPSEELFRRLESLNPLVLPVK